MLWSVEQCCANMPVSGARIWGLIRQILDRIVANQIVVAFDVCPLKLKQYAYSDASLSRSVFFGAVVSLRHTAEHCILR